MHADADVNMQRLVVCPSFLSVRVFFCLLCLTAHVVDWTQICNICNLFCLSACAFTAFGSRDHLQERLDNIQKLVDNRQESVDL